MKILLSLIAAALIIMPEGGSVTVMAGDMLHPVIIGAPGTTATDWFEGTWGDENVKVKESKRVTYQTFWREK